MMRLFSVETEHDSIYVIARSPSHAENLVLLSRRNYKDSYRNILAIKPLGKLLDADDSSINSKTVLIEDNLFERLDKNHMSKFPPLEYFEGSSNVTKYTLKEGQKYKLLIRCLDDDLNMYYVSYIGDFKINNEGKHKIWRLSVEDNEELLEDFDFIDRKKHHFIERITLIKN